MLHCFELPEIKERTHSMTCAEMQIETQTSNPSSTRSMASCNLRQLTNSELCLRMEKLAQTERKITHLVLLHLNEIEERLIYAELGYGSLFAYLTQKLGYSESSAYRRIHSARLLKQIPQVAEQIQTGALNLSQLTQVQKCLRQQTQSGKAVSKTKTLEILNKLENQNGFETQKTLAKELDLPVMTEQKVRPQQDESIRLEVTFSKDQFAELELSKSLLSHICHEGLWNDVLATLAKNFNKKKLQGRTRPSGEALR
jgi:hypothetical protein